MRRAHFIVGFSNWGKTTLIYKLLGDRDRRKFMFDGIYYIPGVDNTPGFMVQSQSNDDVKFDIVPLIQRRIDKTALYEPDLLSALCPAMDPGMNFIEILKNPTFDIFHEFHFYLIKYRFEHHAQLLPDNIKKTYDNLRLNSYFHIIDADEFIDFDDRLGAKVKQTKEILRSIYSK